MDKSKSTVLFAVLIAILLFAAYHVRTSLLMLYVSAIFAIVLSPAVDRVCRVKILKWHPGRGSAILLILGAVLLAFTILFLFGLPPVIRDLQQLFTGLPDELKRLREHMRNIPYLDQIDASRIQEYSSAVLSQIPQLVGGIASGAATVAAIVILTAYLILEGEALFNWAMSLLPPEKSSRLRPVLIKAAERMRRWLVGQAILMLILGSASVLVFGLLGVRYFYLIGVFTGLLNFIPWLGPIVSVFIAGFVAALDSWNKLLGVVIFYLAYQQVESAFLSPKIMKAQVELSASAVIVVLLIGAELAGIAGAMMAVPTAVLASVLIDAFVVKRNPEF